MFKQHVVLNDNFRSFPSHEQPLRILRYYYTIVAAISPKLPPLSLPFQCCESSPWMQEVKSSDDILAVIDDKAIGETVEV